MDNMTIRVAMARGVSYEEADRIIDRHYAEAEARHAIYDAEREAARAELDALAGVPITAETAAKVAKKFTKRLNKDCRYRIAQIVGKQTWVRMSNPQTREAAISTLDEKAGREVVKA